MREANFSIPSANKACVGITTALYDRRALDCTSTLPLINSLNHLAYLTTSSGRIRDILTVDGGIERLVCILKEGRSKDMMEMWKWNLAFQCVVNIGVRGTEAVRTRVVEADIVPVVATILDNYLRVIEKIREKTEEAKHKSDHHRHRTSNSNRVHKSSTFSSRAGTLDVDQRTFRRQAPPPSIDVSAALAGPSATAIQSNSDPTPTAPQFQITSPGDRTPLTAHRHPHHVIASPSAATSQPIAPVVPSMDTADGLAVRPAARDVDRLGSTLTFSRRVASQPASPTTPLPPPQLRSPTVRPTSMTAAATRPRRRPSIRHQHSTGVEPEDAHADSVVSEDSPDTEMSNTGEPQPAVGVQEVAVEDGDSIMAGGAIDLEPSTTASETQDAGTFNIAHQGQAEPSVTANNAPRPVAPISLSPHRPTLTNQPVPTLTNASIPRYLLERHVYPNPSMIAAMPREEDVLMSLQLLAYVSKYCNLRKYFQNSHLVPKLKIGKEIQLLDGVDPAVLERELEQEEENLEEEYLLPNDLNIFPLVEKFTVRYHSTDMQYWAGVVMRNLCRKDDSRGGIRQCAYYQCGKWEEYTRQFAKCRRCRRTKYCSKECQKSAWAYHRHWCIAVPQQPAQ
ncbi:hypothetical protein VTJ83DRAFT_5707 [Remersonia thermophila]|uniref:MYND-type zinc finger protein samB n=1 Tax=Remersonia thermophila TaxID=72144 RepID=A0ABR4D8E6_9PEZI